MAPATAVKKTAPRKTTAKRTAKPPAELVAPDLRFELVPHGLIDLNLDNVRHEIVRDDELEALGENILTHGLSLPLLLHPHPDVPGRYVLIDGHRRHVSVALTANPPAMPSLIRPAYATRAELIAAMLGTYLHTQGLSPVEEAEAYEAMALDGLDDDAIAEMTGAGSRRVRDRRKLLGLRPEHQAKLHTGQLTIEHAAALVEFADDARATTEIERAITGGSLYDIKNTIATAKGRRERDALQAKTEAKLRKAGVKVLAEAEWPGPRTWPNPYVLGPNRGADNGLPADREEHDTTSCKNLAAHVRYGDDITWFCLDPTAHGLPMPGQTDAVAEAEELEESRDREAAAVAEATERAEQLAQFDAARVLRRDYLTALIRGEAALTSDMVDALMTYFVLMQIDTYVEAALTDLAVWVGMDDDLIDQLTDASTSPAAEADARTRIAKLPGARALLALAATDGEDQLGTVGSWAPRGLTGSRRAWLTLVGGPLGYEWSDWEAARIDAADALQAAAVTEAAEDEV